MTPCWQPTSDHNDACMAWLLSYCSVQELACCLPANRLQPGAQPLNVASQAGPAVGREPIGHRVNVPNESFVDTSRIRALRRLDECEGPSQYVYGSNPELVVGGKQPGHLRLMGINQRRDLFTQLALGHRFLPEGSEEGELGRVEFIEEFEDARGDSAREELLNSGPGICPNGMEGQWISVQSHVVANESDEPVSV